MTQKTKICRRTLKRNGSILFNLWLTKNKLSAKRRKMRFIYTRIVKHKNEVNYHYSTNSDKNKKVFFCNMGTSNTPKYHYTLGYTACKCTCICSQLDTTLLWTLHCTMLWCFFLEPCTGTDEN